MTCEKCEKGVVIAKNGKTTKCTNCNGTGKTTSTPTSGNCLFLAFRKMEKERLYDEPLVVPTATHSDFDARQKAAIVLSCHPDEIKLFGPYEVKT